MKSVLLHNSVLHSCSVSHLWQEEWALVWRRRGVGGGGGTPWSFDFPFNMLFSEPYFRPEKGIRILMLIAIHLSLSMGDGDGSFFWKAHPVVGQNSQEIHHYNPKWSKTTCYRRPTKLKAIPVDAAYNLALSPDYIRTHQGLSFHRRKTLFYLAFSILLAAVFLPTLSNQYACPAENLEYLV